MSWSIDSVSYRMSGSGSWQYLLTDAASEKFYAEIYPQGVPLSDLDPSQLELISFWQGAHIIKIEKGRAMPMGPIMTEADLAVLKSWFDNLAQTMCDAVKQQLSAYRDMAKQLAEKDDTDLLNNILTIMICAHTLDSMVFSHLRKTAMGSYVDRGSVGNFYFWGYAFSEGPRHIFGFTSYGGGHKAAVHVMRSRGLGRDRLKQVLRNRETTGFLHEKYISPILAGVREIATKGFNEKENAIVENLQAARVVAADDPGRLAIPVFMGDTMKAASALYLTSARLIARDFMNRMDELGGIVRQCTFSRCPSADVLCMLFHLAYSYAADTLVAEGIVPEFPDMATAEWGVWVH